MEVQNCRFGNGIRLNVSRHAQPPLARAEITLPNRITAYCESLGEDGARLCITAKGLSDRTALVAALRKAADAL